VLCAAAVFGWVRSYGARDVYKLGGNGGGEHFIYSDHGQLEWIAQPTTANERSVRFPWWLPAGLTAILPIAWFVRGRGHTDGY
jgi:hypothetical protein